MHLKRWLTAIILLPVLIFMIGPAPGWLLCIFLYVTSLGALSEFFRSSGPKLPRYASWSSYFLLAPLFVVFFFRQILFALPIISLWVVVPMTLAMLSRTSPGSHRTTDVSKTALGMLYVGLPLAMLVPIDQFYPQGDMWIFFLLVTVFACDTAAFYAGKVCGRHKLHQAISPGKTWEGAFGGLLGSFLGAYAFLKITALHPFTLAMGVLIFFLSLASQIGDLAESMLKRNGGLKDSGNLLPGHGGILDRIDGILFTVPILYIYLNISVV